MLTCVNVCAHMFVCVCGDAYMGVSMCPYLLPCVSVYTCMLFVHNHVQECVGVCMHAHICFEYCVSLFLFFLPSITTSSFLSSSSLLEQALYDALGILEHTV